MARRRSMCFGRDIIEWAVLQEWSNRSTGERPPLDITVRFQLVFRCSCLVTNTPSHRNSVTRRQTRPSTPFDFPHICICKAQSLALFSNRPKRQATTRMKPYANDKHLTTRRRQPLWWRFCFGFCRLFSLSSPFPLSLFLFLPFLVKFHFANIKFCVDLKEKNARKKRREK